MNRMSVGAIGSNAGPWQWQSQTPPSPPPMTNTAQLLGMSTSQLAQDLQSGTTLGNLASKQGVSSSSLISSIEKDLQANAPQGAPASFSSVLDRIATNIANGTPQAGAGHGPGGAAFAGSGLFASSDVSAPAQTSLSSLAGGLGSDPSALLAQIAEGQAISSSQSVTSDTA
jgi:hypothetical protein